MVVHTYVGGIKATFLLESIYTAITPVIIIYFTLFTLASRDPVGGGKCFYKH